MGSNYLFSIQPTFTQGLVLGQLSIFFLLALILKYLFIDTSLPHATASKAAYHPGIDTEANRSLHQQRAQAEQRDGQKGAESAEWFNMLLQQIAEVYRSKLRDDLFGPEGDEIARRKVEAYANRMRPAGFLDHIKVHSVDLGVSAPRLSNARLSSENAHPESPMSAEFDVKYTDTISVALSTSYLFNYPMASFARLPVSLTISLSLFESSILLTPPSPTSPAVLTLTIPQDFTLDLKTTSLMGSRAKLADVPKLHELIQHQVRRVLASKAVWKVVLPGLGSVAAVKEEIREEMQGKHEHADAQIAS
ncbi:hypothetical protein FIBSPDRAFT_836725 [Athelia psychrophila]|uniref:Maintenance of mitochondrial morphology protein 1 n=1 Tax=Athelia psychrophila TaxID=1759441 RepID=A0A166AW66_9AGAM|nr:hypothetical protein FIBSPDRAFT_836725 [Fibularhizoctonia sp. CBS 109695]